MTKVGIIGLGSMGMGMALSIVKQGLQVSGFDLNPAARAKLAETGGVAAASAFAAATGC